jgi:hypothetical protein
MLFLPRKIDECPHVGIVKDGHEWLGLGCSWPLYIIVVTCLFDTLLVTGLLGIILCLNLEKKRKKNSCCSLLPWNDFLGHSGLIAYLHFCNPNILWGCSLLNIFLSLFWLPNNWENASEFVTRYSDELEEYIYLQDNCMCIQPRKKTKRTKLWTSFC